jgi:hypothetical protein
MDQTVVQIPLSCLAILLNARSNLTLFDILAVKWTILAPALVFLADAIEKNSKPGKY